MPILHDIEDGDKTDKGLLSETYEKYKAKVQNAKIIPLEADSLYKVCFELGMLLGIKMKKIRKAYEKALENVNGRSFDCRSMLVMIL
jgi:transposase